MPTHEFQLKVGQQLYDRVIAIARQEQRRSVPEQMAAMLAKAAGQWKKLSLQAVVAPLPAEVVTDEVPVRLYLSGELYGQLQDIARRERRSMTKQIVFMLELAVEHWLALSGQQTWTDPSLTDLRRVPAWVPTA